MKFLRNLLTVVIILAMVAVGVLFALQNKVPVALDLLVYTFPEQSLALWILLALALGGILGMLASSLILLRMRTSLASTKRQLEKSKVEASQLRTESPAAGAS